MESELVKVEQMGQNEEKLDALEAISKAALSATILRSMKYNWQDFDKALASIVGELDLVRHRLAVWNTRSPDPVLDVDVERVKASIFAELGRQRSAHRWIENDGGKREMHYKDERPVDVDALAATLSTKEAALNEVEHK